MYLCQDPEMNAKQIDGVHFLTGKIKIIPALTTKKKIIIIIKIIKTHNLITESLFKLWQLIDNEQKPAERDLAFRALYKTAQEAKAYEDILKEKVFDVVTEECIYSKI